MKRDQIDKPDIDDIAELAARGVVAEMRTNFPARIVTYDRSSYTATIRPVIRGRRWDPVAREVITYLPETIPNCRVVQHVTDAGGVVLPYKPGAFVWAECGQRSLDEWKELGGTDVTPADDRRFEAADAVVTGPIRPKSQAPNPLHSDEDNPVVSGDPLLTGDATASEFVALANLVQSEIASLWTSLNGHIHNDSTGAPTTTPTVGTAGIPGTAGAVAATKVKAK